MAVGGSGVSVGGRDVRVGGTGVGGIGVFVGAGRGVLVRMGLLGTGVLSRGSRVLCGVTVKNSLAVSVGGGVKDGASVSVGSRVAVAVGTNCVTACSVSPTAVFKFATARSTMFKGTSVAGI
jgi:hypothetical protein